MFGGAGGYVPWVDEIPGGGQDCLWLRPETPWPYQKGKPKCLWWLFKATRLREYGCYQVVQAQLLCVYMIPVAFGEKHFYFIITLRTVWPPKGGHTVGLK